MTDSRMGFELHERRVARHIVCMHVPPPLLYLHATPAGHGVDTAFPSHLHTRMSNEGGVDTPLFVGCRSWFPEQAMVCTGPLVPPCKR